MLERIGRWWRLSLAALETANWLLAVFLVATGLTGAVVMAYWSTFWECYWSELGWFGVGLAFLGSLLVLALVFFLIALAALMLTNRKLRASTGLIDSLLPEPDWTIGQANAFLLLKSQRKESPGFDEEVAFRILDSDVRHGAFDTWGRPCINYEPNRAQIDLQFSSEVPIPRAHWHSMRLDQDLFWNMPDPSREYPQLAIPTEGSGHCYGYIRVNRQQFLSKHPPLFPGDI